MGKKLKVLQTRLKSGWRWGWRKEKFCGRRLPACLSMATANSAHARHCLVVWFYPRVSFSLCIASPWMTACRLVPRPWITHPAAADARAVPDRKGPAAHLPAPTIHHPPRPLRLCFPVCSAVSSYDSSRPRRAPFSLPSRVYHLEA